MVYIGIDLGGTHIAAGIVTENGKIVRQRDCRTLPSRPYQEIVSDMARVSLEALSAGGYTLDDVAAVGIGIPGVADPKTGVVIFCTNLAWHDIPLRDEMRKYIDKPVLIDNDATVAGYAESVAGVSRGLSTSVFLTLGTGVGGGIIIGGRPWSGAHNVGSEIGHMTLEVDGIPCTCGNNGCLERYCSATALARMAVEQVQLHPDCALARRCGGDQSRLNAKMVLDLAREGDDIAGRIFRRYVDYLTMAINNIVAFFDPEMIVLGGGVSGAGAFLLDAVRERLPRYLMYKTLPAPRIELATLGNEAGIIGAALLGKE